MKIEKQSVLKLLIVMFYFTTSKAADLSSGPNDEISENPIKNFLKSSFKPFMNNRMDDQSAEDSSYDLSVPSDQTVVPVNDSTDSMETSMEDSNEDASNNSRDFSFSFSFEAVYDTINDSSYESSPQVIYVAPRPKVFTVHVREFFECVSCNADDGARKDFEKCFQNLTLKNQEIATKCCNVSFDSEFCTKASAGEIGYKAICQDPEKALKVGDCFWPKVQDKDAADITEYRECKMKILDRYCTTKTPSAGDLDMKNGQV